MASTFVKAAGVVAAFGLGWLIFRPKKSQAAGSGCFDQQGVKAWAIQENLGNLLLIRSKHDLALVPVDGSVQVITIGDVCEVYSFNTQRKKFDPDPARTQSLRTFLASLVPVQGQAVAGVQWLEA